jgi:hypothetical protein
MPKPILTYFREASEHLRSSWTYFKLYRSARRVEDVALFLDVHNGRTNLLDLVKAMHTLATTFQAVLDTKPLEGNMADLRQQVLQRIDQLWKISWRRLPNSLDISSRMV